MIATHQYEIRFFPILNFSDKVRPIAGKFVDLFDQIKINNENTTKEQIILTSIADLIEVGLAWDVIFIRIEDQLDNLSKKNSIIESIFFRIFEELKSISDFPGVKNHFHYSVNFNKNSSEEPIETIFTEKFFSKNLNSRISQNIKNLSVNFSEENENELKIYNVSPFSGVEDIRQKGFALKSPKLIVDLKEQSGLILEHKIIEFTKGELTIKDYRNLNKLAIKNINTIWNL